MTPSRRRTVTATATLRVTGWPTSGGDRWRAPAVVTGHPRSDRIGDGVMLRGRGEPPGLWSRVAGRLADEAPDRAGVPGSFDPARFLRGRGLARSGRLEEARIVETHGDPLANRAGRALAAARHAVVRRLDALFPPDEARLLASVLLGKRGAEVRDLRGAYGAVGLGHLFAVSGLHVGLVAGIWLLGLKALRAGPGVRLVGLAGFLTVYVLLAGLPGSALRAAGLLLAAALASWAGRPHDGLRTLGLLLWLWALATPWALVDSGLRLSFGAAAGILAALRLAGPVLSGLPRIPRAGGQALLVSLGAQFGALPETARSFGWIHPLATALNLAAVPAFGAAVWLAAGALLCPWPWAAQALAADAWLVLRLISGGAGALAAGPDPRIGLPAWGPAGWGVFLGAAAGLALLLYGPTTRRRLLGAVAVLPLLALPLLGRDLERGVMTAVQFDVGQGDCALLVFPDRRAVLIDTGDARDGAGPFTRSVRPWLRREGIDRLAGVVLTHRHADHDAAAEAVGAALPVETWWLGGTTLAPPGADGVRPDPGDTLLVDGDWALVCLSHVKAAHENDSSLALGLADGGRLRGLWAGDLESEGEARLLEAVRAWPPDGVDVLKAGHHGSRTSSSAALLDAARPATVLVSCGVGNRHAHPSHGPFLVDGDTLHALRTDLRGTLTVRWTGPGPPRIETRLRPPPPRLDTAQTGGYHARVPPPQRPPQKRENHAIVAQHGRSRIGPRPQGQGPRDLRSGR